ncbi:MAG TPA: VanZ family protein [Lacipirellulaceae bacterium]|nr:VanZ family protein [Lacipirellulaceae bacterium]
MTMAKKPNFAAYAKLCQLALVCYFAVLFVGTHLPPNSHLLPRSIEHFDKVCHFTGYTILAGLIATTCQMAAGKLALRHLCWIWLGVAIVAAIDEVTQIPVGRDCDIWDWIADILGAVTGLLLFVLLRKILSARVVEQQQSS